MLWNNSVTTSKRRIFSDLARNAAALRPDLVSAQQAFGDWLLATGAYDEAVQLLSEAIKKFKSAAGLHLALADAYYQKGQYDLAWNILQQAPVARVDDKELTIKRLTLSLKTLESLEALDDAKNVATDLLGVDPANKKAISFLGRISRKQGNPEIMFEILRKALVQEPGHTLAYHELALTYALGGQLDKAESMIDLNRFVEVIELDTPRSYQDAAAFEKAIANDIALDPTLAPDPRGKATLGGFQTDPRLPHNEAQVAIHDLLSAIQLRVTRFVSDLTGSDNHPFITRKPQEAILDAWAVVYSPHGRQTAHIHPDGWLSGVYYVTAPGSGPRNESAGCLALGAVSEGLNLNPPWGIREIAPAPGRLVLFPSYIPHATIPSGSPHPRICVAFDVIPSL